MSKVPAVPEVIGALQLTTQALRRMAEVLPTWDDEHLAEFFRNCSELQNGSYYAQCLVAHILYERYLPGATPAEARRRVAQLLHLSPFTVYEMVVTWERVFAALGVEDYVLPAGFYQRAIRAERYGVDPVEAVRYAAHRRQVLGEDYRIADFVEDLKRGLPAPEGNPPASQARTCGRCAFFQPAPEGSALWLVPPGTDRPLAVGSAKGVRYCALRGKLAADLVPYAKTAAECPDFKERGREDHPGERK